MYSLNNFYPSFNFYKDIKILKLSKFFKWLDFECVKPNSHIESETILVQRKGPRKKTVNLYIETKYLKYK